MAKVTPFEDNIDRYDAWFERHKFAYESELRALRELLPKEGVGVEVGVGTGRFAGPLGVGFGVEPSPVMGRRAMERGVRVVAGVAERLPCPGNRFDFVLFVTVLCFLDDIPAALGEAHRVLRPGGVVIVGFIDGESPLGQVYEKRKLDDDFYRDAFFLSPADMAAHLERANFHAPVFRQTICQNPAGMRTPDPVKPGFGEGSFLVVRGSKPG